MLDSRNTSGVFLDCNDTEVCRWEDATGQELSFSFDNPKCVSVVDENGEKRTLFLQSGNDEIEATKILVQGVIEAEVHFVIGNTLYRVKNCISNFASREIISQKTWEVVYVQPGWTQQNFLRSWFD